MGRGARGGDPGGRGSGDGAIPGLRASGSGCLAQVYITRVGAVARCSASPRHSQRKRRRLRTRPTAGDRSQSPTRSRAQPRRSSAGHPGVPGDSELGRHQDSVAREGRVPGGGGRLRPEGLRGGREPRGGWGCRVSHATRVTHTHTHTYRQLLRKPTVRAATWAECSRRAQVTRPHRAWGRRAWPIGLAGGCVPTGRGSVSRGRRVCSVRICVSVGRAGELCGWVRGGLWGSLGAGGSLSTCGMCPCGSAGVRVGQWGPGGAVSPGTLRAMRRAEHRAAGAGRAGTAVPVVGGGGGGAAQGQGQPGRGVRAWATGVTGLTATGLRAVGCARILLLPTVCVVPVDSGVWGRGLLSQPRGPASLPLPAPPRPLAGPRFPLNLLLRDPRPSAASSPTASDPGCRGRGEAAHCLRCGGVGAGWAGGQTERVALLVSVLQS